jgi:hypothetical protein
MEAFGSLLKFVQRLDFLFVISLQLCRFPKANFIGYNLTTTLHSLVINFVHRMFEWYAPINKSTWSGSQITTLILLNTLFLCWMVKKYGFIWVLSIHNKEWCFQWHKQHLLMYYNLHLLMLIVNVRFQTKILFHIFFVCYFFVPNCRTSKLVHFRLEYLLTNAKNWAIGWG